MKKILSLLLGISLLLTLVGCRKNKTTKPITTEPKPATTEVKTTTEPKTTVNPNVDPWYEDEYREISFIAVSNSENDPEFQDGFYYYYLVKMYTTTIKMSETETITAINATGCWAYSDGSTRGDIAYKAYYYNPVQKKVKIVHVGLKGFNYELGTYINGSLYINYLEFDSYFEDQCYEEYIDCSNKTIMYLEYLEEN